MDTPIVNEKRLSSRAEVRWPVVLMTSHGATVAETKNIGASGAFILCHAQLRPKEKVKAFVMAPDRKSLNISGEVAWSNPLSTEEDSPPCGVGIRFTSISPTDRQYLRNLIAEHYGSKKQRLAAKK
ncbi:MAG: PilZ domain-containing protein [Deltaproteobacteria bacterium]|nr:PilZ domain-containing protein [Deltaproteobacteria bacterium]